MSADTARADIEERLDAAAGIAREAGALLMTRFGCRHQVTFKGEVDLVTEADRLSEEFIVGTLADRFPDDAVVAEEGGSRAGSSPWTWVADPLDGTTNFAHGFPFFCVSIGLLREGRPEAGAVYDPVRDELFSASRGKGAWLNGERLAVSRTPILDTSLLVTGFPYDIRRGGETNLENFAAFATRSQAIRRVGSAALDLCYVAAGRFDGYWELKLKAWDLAAGVLIIEEAGGRVTDLAGTGHPLDSLSVLATNGRIHEEMLAVLRAVRNAG